MSRVLVRGFIRRLPRGSVASRSARAAAVSVGVVLPIGSTFVRPFTRESSLPSPGDHGTWVEVRYLLRWRDTSGRKRSRYLSAHSGQEGVNHETGR